MEQFAYQTSGADKYRSDINLAGTGGMSIVSNDDIAGTNNGISTFLGERTIAAMVLRDNYRVLRDKLSTKGLNNDARRMSLSVNKSAASSVDMKMLSDHIIDMDMKKFRAQRRIWLEVVWQQTSSDACKPFELKTGDIIERKVAQLEQYEVFRCRWREEAKRRPLSEELKLLSECFHKGW